MKTFNLPDLGEGLTEAEIVEWHVQIGEEVARDASLVSVETDKAIVEIPSPYHGRVIKRFGEPGDIIETGAPLVEFELEAGTPERIDAGTVVGEVEVGENSIAEPAAPVTAAAAGVKAVPAVRALARRLNVDLSIVKPSGAGDTITKADVERAAAALAAAGEVEPLRGVRRAMAQNMAIAHAEVVPATVVDDADVDRWPPETDSTMRLVGAMAAACAAVPALNVWFDNQSLGRRLMKTVDIGIAVDTADGLFVPVLRDVANREEADLRVGLERLKSDVRGRRIPPEEMRGYTIMLSNFGMLGGRYAVPVVVPPTVAILGAGRIGEQVIAVDGSPAVHRILPLSLTFDHRAVTGGEAARFLAAVIEDLERGG